MNLYHLSIIITYMQETDKHNLEKLSKKIKELRIQKSNSLNNFVYNKGILTTATWSRIENAKYNIKLSTLLKISTMLEINICELLKDINFNYNFNDD